MIGYQLQPIVKLLKVCLGGRYHDLKRRLRWLRKDGYSYGRFIEDGLKRHLPREPITTAENLRLIKIIHAHRVDYFFNSKEEDEIESFSQSLPVG